MNRKMREVIRVVHRCSDRVWSTVRRSATKRDKLWEVWEPRGGETISDRAAS